MSPHFLLTPLISQQAISRKTQSRKIGIMQNQLPDSAEKILHIRAAGKDGLHSIKVLHRGANNELHDLLE